jgi:hypothetical protein
MEEELTTVRARRPPRLAGLPVDRPPPRHGRPAEKLSNLSRKPRKKRPPLATRMRAPQSDPKGAGLHRRWARESGNTSVRRRKRRGRGKGRRGQQTRRGGRRGGGLPGFFFGAVVVGFTRPQPEARRERDSFR